MDKPVHHRQQNDANTVDAEPNWLNRWVGSKYCYAVVYIARISRLANKRPNLVVWPMSLVCHGVGTSTLPARRGNCTNSTSNTIQVCVWTVNMWFRLEHEDNTAEVEAENMLDPKAHILSIQDHYQLYCQAHCSGLSKCLWSLTCGYLSAIGWRCFSLCVNWLTYCRLKNAVTWSIIRHLIG